MASLCLQYLLGIQRIRALVLEGTLEYAQQSLEDAKSEISFPRLEHTKGAASSKHDIVIFVSLAYSHYSRCTGLQMYLIRCIGLEYAGRCNSDETVSKKLLCHLKLSV